MGLRFLLACQLCGTKGFTVWSLPFLQGQAQALLRNPWAPGTMLEGVMWARFHTQGGPGDF